MLTLSIIIILVILFFYSVVKIQDSIDDKNKIPSSLKLYYIRGIDELDSYKNKEVNLSFSFDKKLRASKLGCSFELPFDKIKSVEIKEENQLVEEEKSIIGRALIGGIIAGPIGAVIGGMTGLSKNKVEQKVFFFIITTIYDKKIIFALRDAIPELRGRLAEYRAYINRNIRIK